MHLTVLNAVVACVFQSLVTFPPPIVTAPCPRSHTMADPAAVPTEGEPVAPGQAEPGTEAAEAGVEPAPAEAPAAEEPKPAPKPGKIRPRSTARNLPIAEVYKEEVKQWVLATGTRLPLDTLHVDYGMTEGQTRPLDNNEVERKLRQLQLNPPLEPVRVTVWKKAGVSPSVIVLDMSV